MTANGTLLLLWIAMAVPQEVRAQTGTAPVDGKKKVRFQQKDSGEWSVVPVDSPVAEKTVGAESEPTIPEATRWLKPTLEQNSAFTWSCPLKPQPFCKEYTNSEEDALWSKCEACVLDYSYNFVLESVVLTGCEAQVRRVVRTRFVWDLKHPKNFSACAKAKAMDFAAGHPRDWSGVAATDFRFNWADIDGDATELTEQLPADQGLQPIDRKQKKPVCFWDGSGALNRIVLKTRGARRVIAYAESDGTKGNRADLDFVMSDYEFALKVRKAVAFLSEKCRTTKRDPF